MRKGNIIVDQVTKDGMLIEDYDISLSPQEIFFELKKYFPGLYKARTTPTIYIGTYRGNRYAIRCKNVTYLGNPHPLYKKRIQIADDLYEFYRIALQQEAEPILLGIYTCGDNTIFVDFRIDTYIQKSAHNSSAHVYTSDLVAASVEGYFQKIDYFGNVVTVFRPDVVRVFLDEYFETRNILDLTEKGMVGDNAPYFGENKCGDQRSFRTANETCNYAKFRKKETINRTLTYAQKFSEKIIPELKRFFWKEEKEWNGIECYRKMIASNYRNKFQPEWVGFFLEFEFERYIRENKLDNIITYYQDKKEGGIDLDLYFPEIDSFGDLKAHSEESRGIQGNDWNTIFSIIEEEEMSSHVYYIVCEHATEKDSLYNYEVTRFWNEMQKKTNIMSYHKRMKHNVILKKVYILDINYFNRKFLTKFKQGINSNGKPRSPKIMIEKENLRYFIVEEIDL